MSRKTDLEEHIRESYKLIRECEDILRLSGNPKEQARAERAIRKQWSLIEGYMNEHLLLCRRMGTPPPTDIGEIATRFEMAVDKPTLYGTAASSSASPPDGPAQATSPPATAPTPGGVTYITHIQHAQGIAIGDGAQVVSTPGQSGPAPRPGAPARSTPPPELSALRRWLNQYFADPDLDAFCLDHFPEVYDKFTRGLQKGEKITLLLDHCRREPARWQTLLTALESQAV